MMDLADTINAQMTLPEDRTPEQVEAVRVFEAKDELKAALTALDPAAFGVNGASSEYRQKVHVQYTLRGDESAKTYGLWIDDCHDAYLNEKAKIEAGETVDIPAIVWPVKPA